MEPTNEQPPSVADIDRQIAALQTQRREAQMRAFPTFEEYARLPWVNNGAGVIRSASGACVLIVTEHDVQGDSREAMKRVGAIVLHAVNNYARVVRERDALLTIVRDLAGVYTVETDQIALLALVSRARKEMSEQER